LRPYKQDLRKPIPEDEMTKNEKEMSRVTRSKEEAKNTYDKMSRWYDVLAGRFEKPFRKIGLEKLDAREGEAVLEIGFGTGHCILALAHSVGDTGRVYGIDISEGMLEITLARVRKAGLSKRVELRCGDAARLPFEANSADGVFMSFTLELFDTPEIPAVLHECRRVLRSGGRLCAVAMSKKEKPGAMARIYEGLHRRFPRYMDCRPIYLQRALKEAGFEPLDAREMSMWRLPVEIVLAKRL
jgi:demethylmenaquinone methyltransferase/2-methoxy-6-polyprenyl-1,4-benzoquinol methylase